MYNNEDRSWYFLSEGTHSRKRYEDLCKADEDTTFCGKLEGMEIFADQLKSGKYEKYNEEDYKKITEAFLWMTFQLKRLKKKYYINRYSTKQIQNMIKSLTDNSMYFGTVPYESEK